MDILILGAGGHGKVVADIFTTQGVRVAGFLDDDPEMWGRSVAGLPVLGAIGRFPEFAPGPMVLGIGANRVRRQLVETLGQEVEPRWCNAIHPTATVARSATLGRGVVVAAHVVVNPDALIGDHVILNTGATIDHDCTIARYSHIAPGVHLGGGVTIGEGVLVGIGATVIPFRTVGEWAVVGAGAVVVRDIPGHVTAKGVPARWHAG